MPLGTSPVSAYSEATASGKAGESASASRSETAATSGASTPIQRWASSSRARALSDGGGGAGTTGARPDTGLALARHLPPQLAQVVPRRLQRQRPAQGLVGGVGLQGASMNGQQLP